jgi:hypothetical protein
MERLIKFESIYSFEFFSSNSEHRALCVRVLSGEALSEQVSNSMRVLVPADTLARNPKAIRDSLHYRVPVYFGEDRTDMFSEKRLKQVAGYTLAEAHKRLDPMVRYTVVGRVLATSATVKKPSWAYCAHPWSVNFESPDTTDYAMYTKGGRILRDPYEAVVRDMALMIAEAGLHAKIDSGATSVDMLVPMIGLGAFMSAITSKADQAWALEVYLRALSDMTRFERFDGVNVGLYDFEGRITAAQVKNHEHDRFQIHRGNKNGDMFAAAGRLFKTSPCMCVVNAYDSLSFVGNGGSSDPTVDGMLIAGSVSGGKWSNSSYTHNSFLMPVVLDKVSWQAVSMPVDNEPEEDFEEEEETIEAPVQQQQEEEDEEDVTAPASTIQLVALVTSDGRFLAPGPVSAVPRDERPDGIVGCVCVTVERFEWSYDSDTGALTDPTTGYAWDVYDVDNLGMVYLWRRANRSDQQRFVLDDKQSRVILLGVATMALGLTAKGVAQFVPIKKAERLRFEQADGDDENDDDDNDDTSTVVGARVWGTVTESGEFLEVRLDEGGPSSVSRDTLVRVAQRYAREHRPKWQVDAPRSWSQGSGPHVTLAPSMRKYLGKRIRVTLGEPYDFATPTSRWVVLDAAIAACYDCGEFACHVSIGQQALA